MHRIYYTLKIIWVFSLILFQYLNGKQIKKKQQHINNNLQFFELYSTDDVTLHLNIGRYRYNHNAIKYKTKEVIKSSYFLSYGKEHTSMYNSIPYYNNTYKYIYIRVESSHRISHIKVSFPPHTLIYKRAIFFYSIFMIFFMANRTPRVNS